MYNLLEEIIRPFIMATLDFNFTNFTGGGLVRWGFDPYYAIFGNFTWGIILGFIGTGLYAGERSIGTILIYLLLVGIFFSIIFPAPLIYLFGLIFTFLVTIVLYKVFVEKRK